MLGVQAVAQLADARGNLVELDRLLATISLHDVQPHMAGIGSGEMNTHGTLLAILGIPTFIDPKNRKMPPSVCGALSFQR